MRNQSMSYLKVLIVIVALGAVGCSTARVRVMPGEGGANKVVARDIHREGAEEAALKAANEYCEEHGRKQAIFKKDETEYTGEMDEGTRNTIHRASTAAMFMGQHGSLARNAGMVGYSATSGRDYKSELDFRCE